LVLGVGEDAKQDNFTSIWPEHAGETPARAIQKRDQIENTLPQIQLKRKKNCHKPLNLRPFIQDGEGILGFKPLNRLLFVTATILG
jgi:hypothetical protein